MDDAVDGGAADAVSLGDLAQALAAAAIAADGLPIDSDRLPADVPAFRPGASHAGFHSLDGTWSIGANVPGV